MASARHKLRTSFPVLSYTPALVLAAAGKLKVKAGCRLGKLGVGVVLVADVVLPCEGRATVLASAGTGLAGSLGCRGTTRPGRKPAAVAELSSAACCSASPAGSAVAALDWDWFDGSLAPPPPPHAAIQSVSEHTVPRLTPRLLTSNTHMFAPRRHGSAGTEQEVNGASGPLQALPRYRRGSQALENSSRGSRRETPS